ncbi:Hypothetical_protein [Hexamita inflata]|uniref:Hypothetical_protein n=1 Tax=Hexamita inflata TaxID=28002 RepID=A0AA86NNS5_9EUKA|nr:Hypothetical protein HINF_LOCUS11427 [Hexamita inflata]
MNNSVVLQVQMSQICTFWKPSNMICLQLKPLQLFATDYEISTSQFIGICKQMNQIRECLTVYNIISANIQINKALQMYKIQNIGYLIISQSYCFQLFTINQIRYIRYHIVMG